MYDRYYQTKKDAARRIYAAHPLIYSPFFDADILLSSEGFRHLCISSQGDRSREEQIPLIYIASPRPPYPGETATTLRSYKKRLAAVGASGNGHQRKLVQWWSFVEHFTEQGIKVGVVVRKVGNGNLHFWSVILYTNWNGPGTPHVSPRTRDQVPPGEASRIALPCVTNAPTTRG